MRPWIVFTAAIAAGCGAGHPVNDVAAAARRGDLARIETLAARGASLDEPSGVNGWAPVVHAVHTRQLASLTRLVELGASLEGRTGRSALLMASGYGDEAMVALLLEHGVPPRIGDDDGTGVLSAALQGAWDIDARWNGCEAHAGVVRTLLAHDPTLRLDHGLEAKAARAWARYQSCGELLRLTARR